MESLMIAIPCSECGAVVWCTIFEAEESQCPSCGASKVKSLYLRTCTDDQAYDFFWNRLVPEDIARRRRPLYRIPRIRQGD